MECHGAWVCSRRPKVTTARNSCRGTRLIPFPDIAWYSQMLTDKGYSVSESTNKSRCETLAHIYLSYLSDRDVSVTRVGWAQVLRDAWFGVLVWLAVCLVVLFVAGFAWLAVPVGLCLGSALVVTIIRRTIGHTFKCSLLYGLHWPLQLGELI